MGSTETKIDQVNQERKREKERRERKREIKGTETHRLHTSGSALVVCAGSDVTASPSLSVTPCASGCDDAAGVGGCAWSAVTGALSAGPVPVLSAAVSAVPALTPAEGATPAGSAARVSSVVVTGSGLILASVGGAVGCGAVVVA